MKETRTLFSLLYIHPNYRYNIPACKIQVIQSVMLISFVLACSFANIKLFEHLHMMYIYISVYLYVNYINSKENATVSRKFQNLLDYVDWLEKLLNQYGSVVS
jgi:hypothetical protein